MDRAKLWQILKKEFTIPKDALRLSLYISGVLNLILFFGALHFWQEIRNREMQANFIAYMATNEMASCDVQHGEPKYIEIKIVPFDELVESLREPLRPTGEMYGNLPVWEWRLAESNAEDAWILARSFADRYNEDVSSRLGLDRERDEDPIRP